MYIYIYTYICRYMFTYTHRHEYKIFNTEPPSAGSRRAAGGDSTVSGTGRRSAASLPGIVRLCGSRGMRSGGWDVWSSKTQNFTPNPPSPNQRGSGFEAGRLGV